MSHKNYRPLPVVTRKGYRAKGFASLTELEAMQRLARACEILHLAREREGPHCPAPDLHTFPEFRVLDEEVEELAEWRGIARPFRRFLQ